MNPRYFALKVIHEVIYQGKSLNSFTTQFTEKLPNDKDRSLARELVYGTLRWQPQLNFLLSKLLKKPLRAKESEVSCILYLGLYQLFFMRTPDHAAVSESVKLVQKLKKNWAKALINGTLRQSIRDKERLLSLVNENEEARFAHPEWLINKLKTDWPDNWESLLEENNCQAPMTLRVNQQKYTREQYSEMLSSTGMRFEPGKISQQAITLTSACDVQQLPEFSKGAVSVQDEAAQLAAQLLKLKPKLTVLDACAAPGGKSAHLLETQPDINLLCLDVSEERTALIQQTLKRLNLSCHVKSEDANCLDNWWDGELYDRILLDAPCSALGVIRRNPDIKIHRKLEDISQLVENQRNLLSSMWQILKPGGYLLYATCSILKEENENQVQSFKESRQDLEIVSIELDGSNPAMVGKQIFPGSNGMDGFYYALLRKLE